MTPPPEPPRPVLDLGGPDAGDAAAAVAGLIAELQEGWERRDAEVSNRRFARDILWGSPFGGTVCGYDRLHAIHLRLKQRGTGGPLSRYEVVEVLAPSPDVAVAQVRRVALDPAGQPVPLGSAESVDAGQPFSEMAMYVLVRRDGAWWLAAGQNTPIIAGPRL